MSQPTPQTASLPPARLVRSSHNAAGSSVFASDAIVPSFSPFGPKGAFAVFDTRTSVPVTNTDPIPTFANTLPRCSPAGAVFSLSDINPGSVSPLHRTESIDYCVVLSGEIVLRLDNGEEKVVKAGEFIVQQGANHQWMNKSDSPCRLVFVMLGAKKVELADGTVFEETVIRG